MCPSGLDFVCALKSKLVVAIINPLILLFMAVAVVVFVWGVIEFLWGLSNDSEGKEHGKQHMLWGIIGLFIMLAAYAILKIINNTVGAGAPL